LTTLLTLENVVSGYDHLMALHDLCLTVNKGEIVCLIGSNGAGKTTTLKTISGLIKTKKGQIYFKDKTIQNLSAHSRTALGISHVPEGRGIFNEMSVLENLALGAFLLQDKQEYQKRLQYAYELFPKLKDRAMQNAGTLSGGEQQMLAIARAIIQGGDIILLDEPSMGLAPMIVEHIFEVICTLNQQGKTILLVEQNAHLALQIAHRGYVIQSGKCVLSGDAQALLHDPMVQEIYLGVVASPRIYC